MKPAAALALALAYLTVPSVSVAQSVGAMLSTGYSYPTQIHSYGLTMGGAIRARRFVTHTLLGASFYQGELRGFSMTPFGCKNLSNGQFATTGSCRPPIHNIVRVMVDGNLILPKLPLMAGGGLRTGNDSGGYAALAFIQPIRETRSFWFVRVTGGRNLAQMHVGVTLLR